MAETEQRFTPKVIGQRPKKGETWGCDPKLVGRDQEEFLCEVMGIRRVKGKGRLYTVKDVETGAEKEFPERSLEMPFVLYGGSWLPSGGTNRYSLH